jgi:hypothetical protein
MTSLCRGYFVTRKPEKMKLIRQVSCGLEKGYHER